MNIQANIYNDRSDLRRERDDQFFFFCSGTKVELIYKFFSFNYIFYTIKVSSIFIILFLFRYPCDFFLSNFYFLKKVISPSLE